jgi:hypothetical protein
MSVTAADLTVEELAKSEAELLAMMADLHRDIETRDTMISVLLDVLFVTQKREERTIERLRELRARVR